MFKKLFSAVLILLLLSAPAFAGYDEGNMLLNDSDGNLISDLDLTTGSAIYSERINIDYAAGFVAILLVEDKAGGAGDVDISIEYSSDGTNWYIAYTSDMAGTITADGDVVTAFGNTTGYVVFTLRPAKYMRYKFDPDADSQLTARHSYIVHK